MSIRPAGPELLGGRRLRHPDPVADSGRVDGLPGAGQQVRNAQANDDGSFELYFGPKAPDGKETNWVETIPGKSWFQLFRLYGPLQPWFDHAWKLNEFEPIVAKESALAPPMLPPRASASSDQA